MARTKTSAAKAAAEEPKVEPTAAAEETTTEEAPAPEAPATEEPKAEEPKAEEPKAEEPQLAGPKDAKQGGTIDGAKDVTQLTTAAAPLDAPPVAAEAPREEERRQIIKDPSQMGESLVRNAGHGSRLVDAATGKTPDPATLFRKVPGPGSVQVCTVRLCQDTWTMPNTNPIRQLVMPKNQQTDPATAARLTAILQAQADREAALVAAAEAESEAGESGEGEGSDSE